MTKNKIICKASAMDGFQDEFDVVQWCNYRKLSDDEINKIENKKYLINFLLESPYLYFDIEEGDDIPLYSDTYYTFYADNEEELKKAKNKIRKQFDQILKK